MTRVKICGVNDVASFEAVVAAGADWLGLVFFPPSPRFVTPEAAAALVAGARGYPPLIGLFVDPDEDAVARVLDAVPLGGLQVYGRAVDAGALQARFGLPVWRAVGIGSAEDLPRDAGGADALVLEAMPPVDSMRPGGNARRFDWSVLRDWTAPCPWILAGGLTPENVERAICATGAPGVDVSSGVESSPGVKDPALIRAFIARARAA